MGRWRGFLDSLDTDGGHVFCMFVLVFVGIGFFIYDTTAGGSIVTGAVSALYVMLKSKGTNSEQIARAGVPYQPPQPPPAALTPPVVVGEPPLPPSTPAIEPLAEVKP